MLGMDEYIKLINNKHLSLPYLNRITQINEILYFLIENYDTEHLDNEIQTFILLMSDIKYKHIRIILDSIEDVIYLHELDENYEICSVLYKLHTTALNHFYDF